MMNPESEIFKECYIMQPDDIQRFARTLADGFLGYPLFEYVCGGNYSHRKMEIAWAISVALSEPNAICIADSSEVNSVLIYVHPNAKQPGPISHIRVGGLKNLLTLGLTAAVRLSRFESYSQILSSKYQTSNDGYLLAFATRFDKQGQHYGKPLLQALLRYLDASGQGCYLETFKPENVGLYEHFGFELKERATTPDSNLAVFVMLRPSQTRSQSAEGNL